MTLPPTAPDQPMTAEQLLYDNIVGKVCDEHEYSNGDFVHYKDEILKSMKQYAQSVAQEALKDANDNAEDALYKWLGYNPITINLEKAITSTEIKTP